MNETINYLKQYYYTSKLEIFTSLISHKLYNLKLRAVLEFHRRCLSKRSLLSDL